MSTIVFDLEWNTGFVDGNSFDEVLEIGAVMVNQKFEKISAYRRLIRPSVYRQMNPYIGKIVSFTLKDLKKEEPFPTVVQDFFDWCGPQPLLIAWSTNDVGVLDKNLARAGIHFPEGTLCYDLQAAYSYCTEKSIRSYSLKTAVEALELPAPEEQVFHDAYCDALYTASIGKKLLSLYGHLPSKKELDDFRATLVKPKRNKVPLKYSIKKSIFDPKHRSFDCPICGNSMRLLHWYMVDENRFVSHLRCRDCKNDYYPELKCDHFRQSRCDAHFLLWGAGKPEKAALYQSAKTQDLEIPMVPRRRLEVKAE